MSHDMSQNEEGNRNPSEFFLDCEMIRERENMVELKNGWAEMIRRFPWDHWVVSTFAPPPPLDESLASSVKGEGVVTLETAIREHGRFIRRLERTGNPVWWVFAAETGWVGKKIHLHILLGGTENLRTEDIEKAWRAGWSEVCLYDPTRNGVEYILKQLKIGMEPEIASNIHGKIARCRAIRTRS